MKEAINLEATNDSSVHMHKWDDKDHVLHKMGRKKYLKVRIVTFVVK